MKIPKISLAISLLIKRADSIALDSTNEATLEDQAYQQFINTMNLAQEDMRVRTQEAMKDRLVSQIQAQSLMEIASGSGEASQSKQELIDDIEETVYDTTLGYDDTLPPADDTVASEDAPTIGDLQDEGASALDAVESGETPDLYNWDDATIDEEPYVDYEADMEDEMAADEQEMNDLIDGLDLDDTWEVMDGEDYYEEMDPMDYYDEEMYGDESGEDYYEIVVDVPESLAPPVLQDIVDEFDAYYPADNSTVLDDGMGPMLNSTVDASALVECGNGQLANSLAECSPANALVECGNGQLASSLAECSPANALVECGNGQLASSLAECSPANALVECGPGQAPANSLAECGPAN